MGGDEFDDDDPKYKMELKQLIKTKNKCNLNDKSPKWNRNLA